MTLFSGSLDGLKEKVFCAVYSFFTCSCDELLEVLWVLKVDFVNVFNGFKVFSKRPSTLTSHFFHSTLLYKKQRDYFYLLTLSLFEFQ